MGKKPKEKPKKRGEMRIQKPTPCGRTENCGILHTGALQGAI